MLEGYAKGEPIFRQFCIACAERTPLGELAESGPKRGPRLAMTSLMIVAGLGLGMVAVLADNLGLASSQGFGIKQTIGAAIGAGLILIGALARVDLLAMLGTGLFGLSVLADLLRVGESPGVGRKQSLAIAVGISAILVGLLLRWRERRPARKSRPASRVVKAAG